MKTNFDLIVGAHNSDDSDTDLDSIAAWQIIQELKHSTGRDCLGCESYLCTVS